MDEQKCSLPAGTWLVKAIRRSRAQALAAAGERRRMPGRVLIRLT
jgi:hypothetical protein